MGREESSPRASGAQQRGPREGMAGPGRNPRMFAGLGGGTSLPVKAHVKGGSSPQGGKSSTQSVGSSTGATMERPELAHPAVTAGSVWE